jgi:hypothetical protein
MTYENNKYQPENIKLCDTSNNSTRTNSRDRGRVMAGSATYRIHNIVNWVATNLGKLESIKH